MGEEKDLRLEFEKAMLGHIANKMEEYPTWQATFKLEEWDYEDEIEQAKLKAFLEALFNTLLKTQPNDVEITLTWAVAIDACKEDDKEEELVGYA